MVAILLTEENVDDLMQYPLVKRVGTASYLSIREEYFAKWQKLTLEERRKGILEQAQRVNEELAEDVKELAKGAEADLSGENASIAMLQGINRDEPDEDEGLLDYGEGYEDEPEGGINEDSLSGEKGKNAFMAMLQGINSEGADEDEEPLDYGDDSAGDEEPDEDEEPLDYGEGYEEVEDEEPLDYGEDSAEDEEPIHEEKVANPVKETVVRKPTHEEVKYATVKEYVMAHGGVDKKTLVGIYGFKAVQKEVNMGTVFEYGGMVSI